jgi:SpoVK/Ycf46/Vps4 family AAA+-type ATPase
VFAKPEKCPIHGILLELSYRGTKMLADNPSVKIEGVPMLYCPMCLSEGKDTSRELSPKRLRQFEVKLRAALSEVTDNEHFHQPSVTVNFNPSKALLEKDGLGKKTSAAGSLTMADEMRLRVENFTPQPPRYSLDRLILNEATHQQIHTAINLLTQQKLIYETWNLQAIDRVGKKVALNFYGAPGTGKTLAAEALAHHLGKEILFMSYAELESKYVGETPKNIKAAFEKAAASNAVLFFDEADSILGKRLTNVTQATDHSVNLTRSTTLIELDRFSGIVIFASNLVRNYDTAFLRRMIAHVEFMLPALPERIQIWKSHLPPQLPLMPVNFDELARVSEGASGGDIKNAVLLAASLAAMRTKENQIVSEADLVAAIQHVVAAKEKIMSEGNR